MSIWAILCPGKSLREARDVEYDGEQVIAVNYALLFPDIHPTYWAVLDGEVFKECQDHPLYRPSLCAPPVTLWTHDNFENAGRTAAWNVENCEQYRKMPALKWHELSRILPHPGLEARIAWESYTLFTAIGLAVLLGAKRINVYGADFDGHGYFLEGLGNFRTDHRPPRWKREYEEFQRIEKVLSRNGITLLRHAERSSHAL